MFKHKTSVLFVNTNGNKTKQIPTFILMHWKKIAFSVVMIFSLLIAALGLTIYDKTSEHYTSYFQKKLEKSERVRKMIDIEKAKKSFQSIDESMERINIYLAKRGLTEMKLENAGGIIEDLDITDINDVSDFYANHISDVEDILLNTPLGKPHTGDITSHFGGRHNPFTGRSYENHKGIDFRGKIGEPIKATAEGTVSFVGQKGGYGNCVIIKHNNGFETLFAHLSKTTVKEGQKVEIGTEIGKLGNSGRSTGPHLHYEIIKDGMKINPEPYLNF